MRFLPAFAILLILGSGHAAVQVFWPTGAEVGDGASFYLGKVSPGHVLLIITDRGPEEDPYTTVAITPEWPLSYTIDGDRMYIRVRVPKDESGTRQFCLELSGEYSRESFCPSILVTPGLLEFYVQKNVESGVAGERIAVATLVKNASAGETTVRISCSLREKYCRPVKVHVMAGDIKQPELNVVYPFPGIYNIKVIAEDLGSGETKTEDVQIVVRPALRNSMLMLRWGLPVYFPFVMPALAAMSVVG